MRQITRLAVPVLAALALGASSAAAPMTTALPTPSGHHHAKSSHAQTSHATKGGKKHAKSHKKSKKAGTKKHSKHSKRSKSSKSHAKHAKG
jgi:hypothetical protein